MNLLSNDAQNLERAVMGGVLVTYALIAFPVAIALLWALVGWQSLSGTILLILYLIYESLILSQYQKLKYKQTEVTDDRLATVQDIISGIRAVKMYALEWKFSDAVKFLRR
jgi:ABC-type multidrug transport system fused ATPase/permease subunit